MTTVLQFAVLGLGISAIYTLLAQGLIVAYHGSGVINFAQGSMTMFGAFAYYELHERRDVPLVVSIVASIVVLAVVGALTYVLVMRPLRNASAITRVIGTLGLLITLQGIAGLVWGSNTRSVVQFLPDTTFDVGGVTVGTDRLILLAIAIALTVTLSFGFRRTAFGLAIRAAAENQRGAATLAWSPDVLGLATWALAGGLAGLAGALVAPLTGITVSETPLLVIPVLAAALIGGLTSFPMTLLGALGIGIAQSEMTQYVHLVGAPDALPFLVIIFVLVVRGRSLPVRGYLAEGLPGLGSGKLRWWVIAPLVVLTILLILTAEESLVVALTVTFAWAAILLSIVVLLGYAGQPSLAQFALGGLAALVAGRLVFSAGFAFPLAMLVGIVVTALVGMVFALPALRTRGINLAVITLGMGTAVSALVLNNTDVIGDPNGTPVGTQTLFGLDLNPILEPENYALFAFAVFVICALVVANVRRGRVGRRLLAVRTNERAAAALGISVIGAKVYAFGLAAAIAGLGGIVLAFRNLTIVYSDFTPFNSILAVGYGVVGGVGFVAGALSGALLAAGGVGTWLLEELLAGANPLILVLVGGISVMALVVLNPDGLIAANLQQGRAIGRLVGRRVPALRRREGQHSTPVAAAAPAAIERATPATLEVRDLGVRFGGVVALADVSLEVSPGEVLGLMGPNGAGKTTLIDAVTGFVPLAGGEVRVNGERIDSWPAHRRVRAGLSRSFQALELFESSTVEENLRVAGDPRDVGAYFRDLVYPTNPPLPPQTRLAVDAFELGPRLDTRVSALSYGERRLLAIARAMAVGPSILLLDEPAAGLDRRETNELAIVVRRLAKEWGMAVLVIEHDVTFIMDVCDRITVLDFGRQIATGTPYEIRRNRAVVAAYLGEESDVGDRAEAPHVSSGGGVA